MAIATTAPKHELRFFAHHLSPEFDRLHIVPISDVHYGDPLFSEKHFLRTLKYIADTPYAYTILNGDLLNCVIVGRPGNIFRQAVISPQDQRDVMIQYLLPIKHKILAMTTGNHEERLLDLAGFDLSRDIANALNVPYRPEGIGLKISFGHGNNSMPDKPFVYWGYATHGYGGARTKGGKAVKVERLSTYIHCQFYIMSHDHETNAAPGVYLTPDNRESMDKNGFVSCPVSETRKIMVKSNAYLKFGGYGEMKGFSPVDLSAPILILSGHAVPDDFELGAYPSARAII